MALLMGYDVGSSSIKASLLDAETGQEVAAAASPKEELAICAPRPGWAEQDPKVWWEHVQRATGMIRSGTDRNLEDVKAVGISYQMHGLVVVDDCMEVLRPAIIWCDSRCVDIGEEAARRIGPRRCLERLLNFPGNFTASKLKWVMQEEPDCYKRIHKAMLPGDYVALCMTGEAKTTPSGLSEGIFWDFREEGLAHLVMDDYGLSREMIPQVVPTFSIHGTLTQRAAKTLGFKAGTPVSYRAGDQPNNALALNVLDPGEIAATAGTSGVVYGVAGTPVFDPKSRVNTFVHVNHRATLPRYGVLMCLNGAGIQNSWAKQLVSGGTEDFSYDRMNELAEKAPAGSKGLFVFPYGNGAERTLENRELGASILGLNFNIHERRHLLRAVQEGIVFAMNYGLEIMREMGLEVNLARAGRANMFLSPLFRSVFAAVTGAVVELYNTDGAQGAARGAGLGAGIYKDRRQAFQGLKCQLRVEPDPALASCYNRIYSEWSDRLEELQADWKE